MTGFWARTRGICCRSNPEESAEIHEIPGGNRELMLREAEMEQQKKEGETDDGSAMEL